MTKTEQLSLRLPKEIFKSADELSRLDHSDRSSILRKAIEKGLSDLKVETAINEYRQQKLTLSEAAKLAGLAVGEFMDLAVEHGIRSRWTLKDIESEKKIAKGLI